MKIALLIISCICSSAICLTAQSTNDQLNSPASQQTPPAADPNDGKMTNADVIALASLGLSDDIVVSKIYAAKDTDFDTSVTGLTALKSAHVSDDVIRVMLNPHQPRENTPPPPVAPTAVANSDPALGAHSKPRIFFQSKSSGNTWNAARDQSMEMSKDFDKDCPGAQITLVQQSADYTILLSHIELGLVVRDNQVQVADRNGDLISKTKEGGSIRASMKKACEVIVADWSRKAK
jgi:hypothetical protein